MPRVNAGSDAIGRPIASGFNPRRACAARVLRLGTLCPSYTASGLMERNILGRGDNPRILIYPQITNEPRLLLSGVCPVVITKCPVVITKCPVVITKC